MGWGTHGAPGGDDKTDEQRLKELKKVWDIELDEEVAIASNRPRGKLWLLLWKTFQQEEQ